MISVLQWSRQSVISSIILVVLCGIGASILWVHEQSEQPVFFSPLPAALQQTQSDLEPLELIPGAQLTLFPGFVLAGKHEQYDAESLYEKINGKAPLYFDAGFLTLVTQRFLLKEDPSLWFELFVYDMGSSLNAFSVYSTQKRAESKRNPDLEPFAHYQTENGLFLRHGPYYIEVIGSSKSEQLTEAMATVGEDLLRVDAGDGEITELQMFPRKNLVPNSFKLILHNAFGSEVLHNTFIAKYLLNDQPVTAFICRMENPTQAQETAKVYYQLLADSGGIAGTSVDSMQLVDLYGLVEIIFTIGPYVGGIHEGETRKEALEIAGRLRESLLKNQTK